jgi:hypothetical protein
MSTKHSRTHRLKLNKEMKIQVGNEAQSPLASALESETLSAIQIDKER